MLRKSCPRCQRWDATEDTCGRCLRCDCWGAHFGDTFCSDSCSVLYRSCCPNCKTQRKSSNWSITGEFENHEKGIADITNSEETRIKKAFCSEECLESYKKPIGNCLACSKEMTNWTCFEKCKHYCSEECSKKFVTCCSGCGKAKNSTHSTSTFFINTSGAEVWNLVRKFVDGKIRHFCSDTCLKLFEQPCEVCRFQNGNLTISSADENSNNSIAITTDRRIFSKSYEINDSTLAHKTNSTEDKIGKTDSADILKSYFSRYKNHTESLNRIKHFCSQHCQSEFERPIAACKSCDVQLFKYQDPWEDRNICSIKCKKQFDKVCEKCGWRNSCNSSTTNDTNDNSARNSIRNFISASYNNDSLYEKKQVTFCGENCKADYEKPVSKCKVCDEPEFRFSLWKQRNFCGSSACEAKLRRKCDKCGFKNDTNLDSQNKNAFCHFIEVSYSSHGRFYDSLKSHSNYSGKIEKAFCGKRCKYEFEKPVGHCKSCGEDKFRWTNWEANFNNSVDGTNIYESAQHFCSSKCKTEFEKTCDL